jgi:hypothetical protein
MAPACRDVRTAHALAEGTSYMKKEPPERLLLQEVALCLSGADAVFCYFV